MTFGRSKIDGYFKTVEEMKESNPPVGRLVQTTDYYSTQRGGGASYLIKTTAQADADGDVIDGYGNHAINGGLYVAILQSVNNTINISQFGVKSEWKQEVGAYFDDSGALQAADDRAALIDGEVVFPASEGWVYVTKTINKSDRTVWRGLGAACLPDGTPKTMHSDFNGVAISIVPSGATTANESGFYNFGLLGDESLNNNQGIVYSLSGAPGAARSQHLNTVRVLGFTIANIRSTGGGTFYFDRVYSFRSEKSLWLSDVADSWFYACHFGSGKNFSNVNNAITYGVYAVGSSGCNSLTFTTCRFQESLNGRGFLGQRLRDSNFTDCYWDGNDLGGMQLSDFSNITINSGRVWRSGKVGAEREGFLFNSTNGNEARGLSIQGGTKFFNVGDVTQNAGISFVNSGNGLTDVQILGNDFEGVPSSIVNINQATEVIVEGNSKSTMPLFRTQGNSDYTWSYGVSGRNIRYNSSLTEERFLTLSIGATPKGFEIDVTRTAGGAFDLTIYKSNGSTVLANLSTMSWAKLKYNGSDWELISKGSLL